MVRIWLVEENDSEEWQPLLKEHVIVEKGKKELHSFTNECINNGMYHAHNIVDIDSEDTGQHGNTASFLDAVSGLLKFNEGQHINTVMVYSHPTYSIQCMYIIDYDRESGKDPNYLATTVNTENMQIYGPAVFYKIQNKTTVDLDPKELSAMHINFYYVDGVKFNNGQFNVISSNNHLPEMERLFACYNKKIIGDWIILCDIQEILDTLEPGEVDFSSISPETSIMWFKIKQYRGEMAEVVASLENNRSTDMRGSFMELNESYVRYVFSV